MRETANGGRLEGLVIQQLAPLSPGARRRSVAQGVEVTGLSPGRYAIHAVGHFSALIPVTIPADWDEAIQMIEYWRALTLDPFEYDATWSGEIEVRAGSIDSLLVERTPSEEVRVKLRGTLGGFVAVHVSGGTSLLPLSNSYVAVRDVSDWPAYRYDGRTDHTGIALLHLVPGSKWHLLIQHEGFADTTVTVEVPALPSFVDSVRVRMRKLN